MNIVNSYVDSNGNINVTIEEGGQQRDHWMSPTTFLSLEKEEQAEITRLWSLVDWENGQA